MDTCITWIINIIFLKEAPIESLLILRPFYGKIIWANACNMALKQQHMTDAKTVMCEDCKKLVQKLHACLVFATFLSTWYLRAW